MSAIDTFTLADAAIEAARAGWRVFPSRPGSKLPLVKDWPRIATADLATVAAWWRRWPDANISHVPGLSGMFIVDLDVDPDAGLDGFATWRKLQRVHGLAPTTRMVLSPSGGLHLYFTAPADLYVKSVAGRIGQTLTPGVDIRGTVGQAVLPPSVKHDGRRYAWHDPDAPIADPPVWLVAMLQPPPPRHPFSRPAPVGKAGSRLEGLVRVVKACGPADLNNRLHWAACRAGEMIAAGQVDRDTATTALLDAAVDRGHPAPGARGTIASGLRRAGEAS